MSQSSAMKYVSFLPAQSISSRSSPIRAASSSQANIVASKHHVSEMIELSQEERSAFIEDVVTTANAIHKAFHPDKVNYGMYGDTGHHLHMHLVPKYKDEFEWGGTFAMDPNLKKLDEAQCEEVAAKLRAAIKG